MSKNIQDNGVSLGAQLKMAREQEGYTLEKLADLTCLPEDTLKDIEEDCKTTQLQFLGIYAFYLGARLTIQ